MNSYKLSIKQHIIIGLALCGWALLFAYLIKPFEHGEMTPTIWFFVGLAFSVSAFISYMCIAFFQRKVEEKFLKWDYRFEILALLLFYIIYTILTYICYRSPLINGFYTLGEFLNNIIFKIAIIFTPILIVIKQLTGRLFSSKLDDDVIIKGENKLDVIKLKQSQFICASNAQNYVEITYLDGEQLSKKLIRSSLKKILNEHKFLRQIHRSHLINPSHFISWKDSSTIILTQMELPVSKMYKNELPVVK